MSRCRCRYTFEVTHKAAGDEKHTYLITKFPVCDDQGAVSAVGSVAVDVSELRRAEAAVRDAGTRVREVFESLPDAVVVVARDGRIVLINETAEALFGYGRGDLVGKSVELLVAERQRAVVAAGREAAFADPQVHLVDDDDDRMMVARDGREFPVEISLNQTQIDGVPLLSCANRDIIERRRADAVGRAVGFAGLCQRRDAWPFRGP